MNSVWQNTLDSAAAEREVYGEARVLLGFGRMQVSRFVWGRFLARCHLHWPSLTQEIESKLVLICVHLCASVANFLMPVQVRNSENELATDAHRWTQIQCNFILNSTLPK